MKVSIVTISFNQARFLEEAIRSVVEQDYPDIEYIVVDPGSTDGSREIIERYRDKIAHMIFEPDKGPADGLNKGFARATGEIFAYLNADDVLLPGAVRRFAEFFQEHPDVDVCSGHGFKIDEKGRVIGPIYSHRFRVREYVFGACVLVQQSTFFRASIYHAVSGFNTENHVNWDGELWFDMAIKGARFSRMHDFFSCFRMHGDSITVSGRVAHLESDAKKRLAAKLGIAPETLKKRYLQVLYRAANRLTDPVWAWFRIKGLVKGVL